MYGQSNNEETKNDVSHVFYYPTWHIENIQNGYNGSKYLVELSCIYMLR